MCIIRRCSINGSGTSANMNTPREQYAVSSSINRLLHAPFYFLLSVLNGFSSLYILPPLSRFIFPLFSSITAALLSLSFVTFKNAEARIDRGQDFRSISWWPLWPFRRLCESRRLFRFYFHDDKFVFSERRGWNYYNLISDVDIFWIGRKYKFRKSINKTFVWILIILYRVKII